ncbi:MAG: glycosyltransferase, partial [Gemmatimonadaceae bacterium]
LAELVEHGRSGLLAPPGDIAAFAHEVERHATDDALRLAMGAGGRARAAEFGVERMVNGTAMVYEGVMAARGAAAAHASP